MNPYEQLSLNSRTIALYDLEKLTICKKYNVSATSFDIIMFLYNHPCNNTAKEICKMRGIKSGIVSVEVEKLVRAKYLSRKVDSNDRRIQKLTLEPLVEPIAKEGSDLQRQFFHAIYEGLSSEEIQQYDHTTRIIFENIEKLERTGLNNEK